MTYYARHNIGDTVAYRIETDSSIEPLQVATVTGIRYELAPYQGRVTYRLSSGVSIDETAVLGRRDALAAGMEIDDLFDVMDSLGKRISEMETKE